MVVEAKKTNNFRLKFCMASAPQLELLIPASISLKAKNRRKR